MDPTKIASPPGLGQSDASDTLTVADVLGSRFGDAQLVDAAASMFPAPVEARTYGPEANGPDGVLPEGPSFFLTISPGTLQLHATDLAAYHRRRSHLPLPSSREDVLGSMSLHQRVYGDARDLVVRQVLDDLADELGPLDTARESYITHWSSKSRRNMVRVLGSLDYKPLFASGVIALITLTYPGDWETVAPTGAEVKEHLRRFQFRWRKRWGSMPVGAWKLEFQARGAPHFHLVTAVPHVHPLEFRAWVAATWASVVNHPDPVQYARHLSAGTSVDHKEGARMRDPRRLTVYFSKHALKSSGSKEYQHIVPALWRLPGAGPGRFWGVWGLSPALAVVALSPADFIALRRTLRRWAKASRGIKILRSGRLHGGWVLPNDGPGLAVLLSRSIA